MYVNNMLKAGFDKMIKTIQLTVSAIFLTGWHICPPVQSEVLLQNPIIVMLVVVF